MSVTYTHDHENAFRNPSPLSHDALGAVGIALEAGARGDGPLARAHFDDPKLDVLPIMGSKLSPSPELHGAGSGVLDVDYADGSTRTFDVDSDGTIEARRYALAAALVIETDADVSGSDEWLDRALSHIAHAMPDGFPGTVEWCSTPRPITYRPNDDYDVQPRDESAGGRTAR